MYKSKFFCTRSYTRRDERDETQVRTGNEEGSYKGKIEGRDGWWRERDREGRIGGFVLVLERFGWGVVLGIQDGNGEWDEDGTWEGGGMLGLHGSIQAGVAMRRWVVGGKVGGWDIREG